MPSANITRRATTTYRSTDCCAMPTGQAPQHPNNSGEREVKRIVISTVRFVVRDDEDRTRPCLAHAKIGLATAVSAHPEEAGRRRQLT